MARIGYARVSTVDQDLDIQIAKLKPKAAKSFGLRRFPVAAVKGGLS